MQCKYLSWWVRFQSLAVFLIVAKAREFKEKEYVYNFLLLLSTLHILFLSNCYSNAMEILSLSDMNCCFKVDSTEVQTGVTWCSIIWWRRLPSGVGICSHPYLSVISVQYIFMFILTFTDTFFDRSPAVKEQSGGQEDIREVFLELSSKGHQELTGERTWAFTAWTKWKQVWQVSPLLTDGRFWCADQCYLSVNLFGGLWWGLEIWTLKTVPPVFLW